MFWRIHAKKVDMPDGEEPVGDIPVIELSWGWTAGMTSEELAELADDAPQGYESVLTTLDMLELLRDDLDGIIDGSDGSKKCDLCDMAYSSIDAMCRACLKNICHDCRKFDLFVNGIYCQPCWIIGEKHRKEMSFLEKKFDEDIRRTHKKWREDVVKEKGT